MKLEVSVGEVLDKFSILEIKLKEITDENKLVNIRNEHEFISNTISDSDIVVDETFTQYYHRLVNVNEKLWKIEDKLRVYEKAADFGDEFIQAARSVYFINDERAAIKKEINLYYNSDFVEEKSYEKY